jgi:hypothetical protein
VQQDFEWLKTLKVGDEVALDLSDQWRRNHFKICTVAKIAPTGRIRLSDGSQYFPDGKEIGQFYRYPLRQITPQILEIIERRKLMGKLEFDKFKGLLSVERLETLLRWQEELLPKED